MQHCFEEYGINHVTISPEIQRDPQILTESNEETTGNCRLPKVTQSWMRRRCFEETKSGYNYCAI